MLSVLRRYRHRLGRVFTALFALTWMTVALQPCVAKADSAASAMPPMAEHHGAHAPEHAMADQPLFAPDDCPVFDAVDEQAAAKTADAADHVTALLSLFSPSWVLPRAALIAPFTLAPPEPALSPPVLEFRVLLI